MQKDQTYKWPEKKEIFESDIIARFFQYQDLDYYCRNFTFIYAFLVDTKHHRSNTFYYKLFIEIKDAEKHFGDILTSDERKRLRSKTGSKKADE